MNITNDKVTDYIHRFYRPLNEYLGNLRKESEEEHIPIILKETEAFLEVFLKTFKPKRILEIGTAVGYSAIFFAELLPDTEIVTVEANEEKYNVACENIRNRNLEDRIKVYLGDGGDVVNKLADEGEKSFDFVFIDAAKSHYIKFWDASVRLCRKDSVILSDNVLMRGTTVSDEYDKSGRYKTNIRNMREFVEYIHSREYCITSILAIGDGISYSKIIM